MNILFKALAGATLLALFFSTSSAAEWETVKTQGKITARHEAGLIAFERDLILLGGRRINSVNRLDTKTLRWEVLGKTPLEMHHFQPVVWKDRVIIAGAMTGRFPSEKPIANIYYYYPKTDKWEKGPEIPRARRRGGAGVVVHKNKLYIVAGITNGHTDGFVNWLDVFDLKKETWEILPDAPHQRDHFQAAVINGRIYAAGGRQTSHATKEVFSRTVKKVDVYDIKKQQWRSLAEGLPTPRAGNSTFALGGKLYVVGGESSRPTPAHNDVEVFDPKSKRWHQAEALQRGRHGTGLGVARGFLWTASGSGNRGGGPELKSTERMPIK